MVAVTVTMPSSADLAVPGEELGLAGHDVVELLGVGEGLDAAELVLQPGADWMISECLARIAASDWARV